MTSSPTDKPERYGNQRSKVCRAWAKRFRASPTRASPAQWVSTSAALLRHEPLERCDITGLVRLRHDTHPA